MALEPGSYFAGYRIERLLGQGGMGAVYLAKHPRLPRRDALKILDVSLGSDSGFRARFEREAEIAASLDHPNIVSIYDRGIEGERAWISMQFVDGSDAAKLVKQGPSALPPRRAVDIVAQAARGLDYAHRKGLLHRDIKPANLLLAAGEGGDDEHDRVLVADFGIARTLDDTAALTSTGSFLATIAYAAPELIEGTHIDHRVDVYALGCTLYEMLTGSVPFVRETPVAVMHAHLTAPPPRPSQHNPALPSALDAVIARAMAKSPVQRYNSCRELAAEALAAFTGSHPITAAVPTVAWRSGGPQPITGPQSGPAPTVRAPHPATPPRPFANIAGPQQYPPKKSSNVGWIVAGTVAATVVGVLALLIVIGTVVGDPEAGGSSTTSAAAPGGECDEVPAGSTDAAPTSAVDYTDGAAAAQVSPADGAGQCLTFDIDTAERNNADPGNQSFDTGFVAAGGEKLLVTMTSDTLGVGVVDGFVAVRMDGKYYPDSFHEHCTVEITSIDDVTLIGTYDCVGLPEQSNSDDTIDARGWFHVRT